MKPRIVISAVMLMLFTQTCNGLMMVEMIETGGNVEVTVSGSIDLTGMSRGSTGTNGQMNPGIGQIITGAAASNGAQTAVHFLFPFSFPAFGNTANFSPTSGTGPMQGINSGTVFVPPTYTGGTLSPSTSIYEGSSFDSLGIIPGTYSSTVPSGDSVTLDISVAVPEPSNFGMLFAGISGLMLMGRQRRTRLK